MQDKNYKSSFLSKPKTPTSQQKYKLPMLTGRIILINFWSEYTGEFVWTAEMEKPHWSTLSSWWSHLDVLFPANTTKTLGFIAFEAWLLHQQGNGRILSLSFNHKLSHASFHVPLQQLVLAGFRQLPINVFYLGLGNGYVIVSNCCTFKQ